MLWRDQDRNVISTKVRSFVLHVTNAAIRPIWFTALHSGLSKLTIVMHQDCLKAHISFITLVSRYSYASSGMDCGTDWFSFLVYWRSLDHLPTQMLPKLVCQVFMIRRGTMLSNTQIKYRNCEVHSINFLYRSILLAAFLKRYLSWWILVCVWC